MSAPKRFHRDPVLSLTTRSQTRSTQILVVNPFRACNLSANQFSHAPPILFGDEGTRAETQSRQQHECFKIEMSKFQSAKSAVKKNNNRSIDCARCPFCMILRKKTKCQLETSMPLRYVLVHRVRHVKCFHAHVLNIPQDWNRRHDGNTHTLHVANVILPFPSFGHHTSQTVQLITRLRRLSRSMAAKAHSRDVENVSLP